MTFAAVSPAKASCVAKCRAMVRRVSWGTLERERKNIPGTSTFGGLEVESETCTREIKDVQHCSVAERKAEELGTKLER